MRHQPLVAGINAIRRKDLRGQRVLLRIDANHDTTLRDSLATLSFLSQSGARIVVATDSDHEIRNRLTELLGCPVGRLDEWKGEPGLRASLRLGEGEITMIENLASEPGEKAADDSLADELSHLCDIYCNEAFGLSHEVRASTVGVAKKASRSVAGLAFDHELHVLESVLREPKWPVLAILGGSLTRNRLALAEEIARRSDRTFVAGQLTFPFLIAKGLDFDHPPVSGEMITIAERMMQDAQDDKRLLFTPIDYVVVEKSKFERLVRGERFPFHPPTETVNESQIKPDHVIGDIGAITLWKWTDLFGLGRTIFWHGPVGITEMPLFCEGTRFLSTEIALHTWKPVHRSFVCGTSLIATLHRFGFSAAGNRHLTPAGETALHFFAGHPLPAVEALSKAALQKRRGYRIVIPLTGSEADIRALNTAADIIPHDAEVFLLHVRSGIDEEQYPDYTAALSEADRFERSRESERIFAEANAILAARGLISAGQASAQGKPREVIARYAHRMDADLMVLGRGHGQPIGLRRLIEDATETTLVA